MKPELLLGPALSLASALAMRFFWTPHKNLWWDTNPEKIATVRIHRAALILGLLLGLALTLIGLGILR
jgi:hypothetical protein